MRGTAFPSERNGAVRCHRQRPPIFLEHAAHETDMRNKQNAIPSTVTGTLNSAVRCDVTTRGLLSVTKDDGTTVILRTNRTDGEPGNQAGLTLARTAVTLVDHRVTVETVAEYVGLGRGTVLIAVGIEDLGL